jgi:hypothetical protein
MLSKIKQNMGIIIFFSLILILIGMIIDSISVPVYGQRIVCGTRTCICTCTDPVGRCYCTYVANVSCKCWCDNDDKDDCTV